MTKLSLFLAVALAAGAAAAGVSGKWTLTVDTGSAHGITTMGLALSEDGKKVGGTLQSPHGDVKVTGEFDDGALRLSTASGDEMSLTLHAKLQKDGTLAGYISTPRGDMKFTGERAK
jgi:hypothetical protein